MCRQEKHRIIRSQSFCKPVPLDCELHKCFSGFLSGPLGGSRQLEYAIVQWLSHIRLLAIPWTVACQASLPFTISQGLLKLISIESVMLSCHLILCCPLVSSDNTTVARVVKNLPANAGDTKDAGLILYPLEQEMAPHSSILACKIPWTTEPSGLQSMERQRVRHG